MSLYECTKPAAMRLAIRPLALLGAAMLCAVLTPPMAIAADAPPVANEKFTGLGPSIKMLRAEIGQNRRDVVAASMLLTKSEGDIFWPLYDQYRAERQQLGDQKVSLITDFIANRDSMSEEQAEKLTQEALDIEKKKIAIKEDYVAKMSKVLSPRTVARFFQIDNKLDAVVDVELAARVPLIH
jgi:hypothetical protein